MRCSKIKETILTLPQLTDFGIGISRYYRNLSELEKNTKFSEEQELLINSAEDFEKACFWLSKMGKIKSINNKHSSYGLKHIAEKEIGYISNGVFIAAAIYCGFELRTYKNNPNACFNISEKSIKGIEKNFK